MDSPAAALSGDYPDVLIIGGEVAGLFCTYFLRRTGISVTVAVRGTAGMHMVWQRVRCQTMHGYSAWPEPDLIVAANLLADEYW
jgi:glycine/D-amino acid oxidase-like deaminating enzyme